MPSPLVQRLPFGSRGRSRPVQAARSGVALTLAAETADDILGAWLRVYAETKRSSK